MRFGGAESVLPLVSSLLGEISTGLRFLLLVGVLLVL